MGLLDNLGLSGLGNSLSSFGKNISNLGTNIDDQTGGLLTRLVQPDNQANLIAAASLLSGEGIPASFALRNQVRSNLLANQQQKDRKKAVDSLLATGGFTNTEKSLITASSNPVATALSIRNSKQPKGTDATALMKNFAFLKKLNPNASDEEILKSIRGGTTNNINVPNQPIIKGDFIYSTGEDGKVTATVIEGSKTDTLRKAAEKKQETLDEKKELTQERVKSSTETVLDEISRAEKLIEENPFLTTGVVGKTLKDLGSLENIASIFGKKDLNPATDLKNLLDTVKSNIGFDRLDAMRKESPTGGALGQVAVKELDFLQASLGSLKQEQSSRQLLENLKRLGERYEGLIKTLATSKEVDEKGRTGIEYLKYFGFTDADIASATGGGATGELGVDYIDGLSEDQLLEVDPLNDNLSEEAFDRYMKRRYK